MKILNNIILGFFLLLSVSSCTSQIDYSKEAKAIDVLVKEKIGISLPALAYLVEQASMEALMSECFLSAAGKYKYVEELLENGFISLTEREVPKILQTGNQGAFKKMILTDKGKEIIKALSLPRKEEMIKAVGTVSCS